MGYAAPIMEKKMEHEMKNEVTKQRGCILAGTPI